MDIIYVLLLLSYFSGLVVYCFLAMSLNLEFISIYFSLFIMIIYQTLNLFSLMIYLTMAVCESVLGLKIMVVTIRGNGNEYVLTMNSLW